MSDIGRYFCSEQNLSQMHSEPFSFEAELTNVHARLTKGAPWPKRGNHDSSIGDAPRSGGAVMFVVICCDHLIASIHALTMTCETHNTLALSQESQPRQGDGISHGVC